MIQWKILRFCTVLLQESSKYLTRMEDWMTPEEKSIIIPHIIGATSPTDPLLLGLKTEHAEDTSEMSSIREKLTQVKKPKFTFETGSTYEGEWDAFGMSGKGVFKMFNGVYYVGEMDDGMMHGKGTVWYPNCSRLEGVWKKGILQEERRFMVFNDNLPFKPVDWAYCTGEDKRFLQEIRYGINPTGRTLLSATVPPKQIPPGCYDTGDGFYNPLTKCVYNAQGDIIRIPKRSEEKFIMENYRKSTGQPSYDLPGVNPFPQEWSDPANQASKNTSGWEEADKSEIMEKDLLSMENEDDKREEKTQEEKCVGRYNLLAMEGDERKFQMMDEGEDSENIAVDLPVMKEYDRRLIINPDVEVTECSEEKSHVIGNKLALLMNVFRKVDQVGGPHKLTEEDCKQFKKQLAVHMSEIDVDVSTEIEMTVDDIESGINAFMLDDDDDIDLVNPDGMLIEPRKEQNLDCFKRRNDSTYKDINGIVEEICDLVLQDTNETDTH